MEALEQRVMHLSFHKRQRNNLHCGECKSTVNVNDNLEKIFTCYLSKGKITQSLLIKDLKHGVTTELKNEIYCNRMCIRWNIWPNFIYVLRKHTARS